MATQQQTEKGPLRNTVTPPIQQPFVGQTSKNLTGGYGYTYTNDVLNSLQPEGVNTNQYQNFGAPSTTPTTPPPSSGGGKGGPIFPGKGSGATVGDQESYAYPGLTNSQVFGLSGMGGAPHNSGATFNGLSPGLQMARQNYLSSPQGQAMLASLGISASNRYAPRDQNGKLLTNSAYQPNNLMQTQQHPTAQQHPLGLHPWQTQQAIGLGYHPMVHPAAAIQHPVTGMLHPNIAQDLLHGDISSLYGGNGGY